MKKALLILFLLGSSIALAQYPRCPDQDLNYQVNRYRKKDTLGDLIISPNAPLFVRNIRNLVFFTPTTSSISVEGGKVCFYNDSTLVIIPHAAQIKFMYEYKSDTLMRTYAVNHFPSIDIVPYFDNRQQPEKSALLNHQDIDSMTFELVLPEAFKYFPEEDFNFTISSAHFYILRNKRPVAEKKGAMETSFFIGDIVKKARPGDKLLIEFYPEWYRNGELLYMACGGLVSFTLGKKNSRKNSGK